MSATLRGTAFIDDVSELVVSNGEVGIWWLGQASFVLRIGNITIYIDPFLTESDRRLVAPPCTGNQVTNADLILLTHGHSDHLDVEAPPLIVKASPQATIVAPRPLVTRIAELIGGGDRIIPADAGSIIRLGRLEVWPIKAKHETFDHHLQLGYPYLGYVFGDEHVTLYHAGDTILYDGLVDTLSPIAINVAMLPINGRDYFRQQRGIAGNLDCREAAEFASLLDVDTVIPIHYGMFAGNTAPPGTFVDNLQATASHIHALVLGLHRLSLYRSRRSDHPGVSTDRRNQH